MTESNAENSSVDKLIITYQDRQLLLCELTDEDARTIQQYKEYIHDQELQDTEELIYERQIQNMYGDGYVIAKVCSDTVEYGRYSESGWQTIMPHTKMCNSTEILIDTMVPYYMETNQNLLGENYYTNLIETIPEKYVATVDEILLEQTELQKEYLALKKNNNN